MEYISVKEVAERWGVDPSRIGKLAREGRIPGAKIVGRNWLIPANAEKPEDQRTRTAKVNPSPAVFRFPVLVNFAEKDFVPPLSPEEAVLRGAQINFYACEFSSAKPVFEQLSQNAESIYVKICALFYLCVLSVIDSESNELKLHYGAMMHLLSEEFPHKHEMALFLPWFDFSVAKFRDIGAKLKKNNTYDYHSTCTYTRAFLSIFQFSTAELSEIDVSILEPYKILSQLAERDGYFVEAQKLHNILFLAYYSIHDEEKMRFHLKKALDIGYEHNLIYPMADAIGYYADEIEPMLSHYPLSFGEKIRTAGKKIAENFSHYAEKNDSAIYAKLSADEYRFLLYVERRYSNKQIAWLCGISERTVANKYNRIYNKLGVTGKLELRREIENDMSRIKKPEHV